MSSRMCRSSSRPGPRTRGSRLRWRPSSRSQLSVSVQLNWLYPRCHLFGSLGNQGKDRGVSRETHILQHLDLAEDTLHLRIILALQLIQHSVAVLPPPVRRRRPKPAPRGRRTAVVPTSSERRWRRSPVSAVAVPAARAGADGPPRGRVPSVSLEERAARVALVKR